MHSTDHPFPTGARLATAKIPFPALSRERRARPWVVLASIAVVLFSVVISQPSSVMPRWLEAESLELSEASLRLAIVRERQRVEAYRAQHGALPRTLEEAGGTLSGVRYVVRADGTYLLEADLGRSYVRLASTGSVEAFLGNSLQVILGRPKG